MTIQPWTTIRSRLIGDFRVFQLRADLRKSPRTGTEHEFYILESVSWVNVVALTPDQNLVMVEQYRHGTNTIELEIPGGMVDPHDRSPLEAGLRELREETGYEGEESEIIGEVFANPAILTNSCFTVLVKNCQLKHELQLDHGEDVSVRLVPVAELPGLVAKGKIKHSIIVAALYYFDLWQRQKGK